MLCPLGLIFVCTAGGNPIQKLSLKMQTKIPRGCFT